MSNRVRARFNALLLVVGVVVALAVTSSGFFQQANAAAAQDRHRRGLPATEPGNVTAEVLTAAGAVAGSSHATAGPVSCPAPGLCILAHGSPGCSDESCCNAVCSIEPSCCDVAWDETCVQHAEAVCEPCIGECVDGGYCDNPECCVDPNDCVCYPPEAKVSMALCAACGCCNGDITGDGVVDFFDLLAILDCVNGGISCKVDPNCDGVQDEHDIDVVTCLVGGGDPETCCAGEDCNADSVRDDCAIAKGISLDLNGDGIPDDCQPGGRIHGTVATIVPVGDGDVRMVLLPDIEFFAQSAIGVSPTVSTDLGGHFVIPHMLSGDYSLCWSGDGYSAACGAEVITIDNDTAYPNLILIEALPGVIFGRAVLDDDRPVAFHDASFDLDVQTQVLLLDNVGQVAAAVRANATGDFVVAGIPAGDYTLRAVAEAASVDVPVEMLGDPVEVDLYLPNRAPIIRVVYADVQSAAPGATVKVTVEASDPDGDDITYEWFAPSVGAPFVSIDSPSVQWTIPHVDGCFLLYVLVRDGRGGMDTGTLKLPTSTAGTMFSGTLRDLDGVVVPDADVSVNGQVTQSNGVGFFSLPVAPADRYVMNVDVEGFQLVSRVTTQGLAEIEIPLVPVTSTVIDPTQPVRIVEPGPYDDEDVLAFAQCLAGPDVEPNPPGSGLRGDCLVAFDFSGDDDVDLADYAELQRRFVRADAAVVEIPANALVDPMGQLAVGPLNVSLSRIDLSDPFGRLPGDFGAINSNGEDVTLISYGAIEIEIRDNAGVAYNLAPGMKASIAIPVQALGEAEPPPVIDLWFYDDVEGMWLEEGSAVRDGLSWTADVSHFSLINADVEFTNPSCMTIAFTPQLCVPFDLRVSIPAVSPTNVFTYYINDPLQLSVLWRLPTNTNIKLEILDRFGNVVGSPLVVNTLTFVPGNGNGPVYPYTGCHPVTMTLPFNIPPDNNNFLLRSGTDTAVDAAAYYAAIDPTSSKTTLSAWISANGFGAPFAETVYYNPLDLGFGRRMKMWKGAGSVRGYAVDNHHNVEETRLAVNKIATVAMEYSQVGNTGPLFTKFYVFDAVGNRILGADLDGRGFKYIPALCIDCHGGYRSSLVGGVYPNNGNTGARFIPFPLDSFAYSQFESSPGVFPFSAASQEGAFKELNREVLTTVPGTAVTELVHGWYGGPTLPNATQNPGFVPAGWSANPNLYNEVVKPSCRICHTTRPGSLDWTKWSASPGFKEYGSLIQSAVCNSKYMPNARCTYELFWGTDQDQLLSTAGLNGWLANQGACP